jgi:hypothetical protein
VVGVITWDEQAARGVGNLGGNGIRGAQETT